jgi:hypothetical protein
VTKSSEPQLPQPYPTTGGPPKTPFEESLFYITGSEEGLSRFRRFLFEGKGWSEDQVTMFLRVMADRWPPTEYPQTPSWLLEQSLLNHPASSSLIQAYGLDRSDRWYRSDHWYDYGGFLHAELPAIRSTYQTWWKRQLGLARTKNLPNKKKNIPKVQKKRLTG